MAENNPSSNNPETFSGRYTLGTASRATPSAMSRDPETVFADLHHATLALELAIPEAELCERLRKAVDDAAGRDANSMRSLRLAIRSFTLALREIGTSPEHVLIALKTVINNRTLVAIAPYASDWNGDELREKISTWCIEEFFRDKTA